MSLNRWTPFGQNIAEVDTYTPASVGIGNTFTLQAGSGRTITFTATATTVANVTAAMSEPLARSLERLGTDAGVGRLDRGAEFESRLRHVGMIARQAGAGVRGRATGRGAYHAS